MKFQIEVILRFEEKKHFMGGGGKMWMQPPPPPPVVKRVKHCNHAHGLDENPVFTSNLIKLGKITFIAFSVKYWNFDQIKSPNLNHTVQ